MLAIVSEVYFRNNVTRARLRGGARRLADQDRADQFGRPIPTFRIADYGTRRRFSRAWQDEVLRTLKRRHRRRSSSAPATCASRCEHGLTPLGTMAHEYLQACQAVGPRLRDSQVFAFNMWAREYRGDLGIALSDVCGMDAFLRDFDLFFCKLFDGVRHDSGDPFEWGEKLIAHYQKMRIDPRSKTMVFSDSLNVPLAIRLFDYFKGRSQTAFGIGTNLTNDLGYEPLADRDQDDALQRPAGGQDQRRAVEGDGLRSVVRRVSARSVPGPPPPPKPRSRCAQGTRDRPALRCSDGLTNTTREISSRCAKPRERRRRRRNRELKRVTVGAAADRRERDRRHAVARRELEAVAIARGEQRTLALVAAAPYGTDGMDDVARRQAITGREPRFAGWTTAERSASRQQIGSGSAVNGAIDAAAAQQRAVGGVDDRVDVQGRDVGARDGQLVGHSRGGGAVTTAQGCEWALPDAAV